MEKPPCYIIAKSSFTQIAMSYLKTDSVLRLSAKYLIPNQSNKPY